MPSVKQIIAEIQLAPDLPPGHKQKAVQIIRDAEARLALKLTSKPRKVVNAKGMMTLTEWEEQRKKQLSIYDLGAWLNYKILDQKMIELMVGEFRNDMIAKGKQYSNFSAAFSVYLRKGYLSKTLEQCKIKSATVIENRGVNL